MKTTPFQQTLKNELSRLERLSYGQDSQSFSLVSFRSARPTKNKHFLLHFFKYTFSF